MKKQPLLFSIALRAVVLLPFLFTRGRIRLFVLFIFFGGWAGKGWGQNIAINSTGNAANLSAGLDINFTNKGLLIPRLTSAERTAMNPLPEAAQGLVVYQTDGTQGFYYNTSTTVVPAWIYVEHAASTWSILGNTGTTAGTHFIGNTDAIPLEIRSNNVQMARFGSSGASPFEPLLFTSSITNPANSAITLCRYNLTAIGQLGTVFSDHIGMDLNLLENSTATMLSSTALDVNVNVNGAGVPAVSTASAIKASITKTAGTISTARVIDIANPAGAGSITDLVGLRIANMTGGGGSNYAIQSNGGQSYHAGNLRVGSTTDPTNQLSVTGNADISGILNSADGTAAAPSLTFTNDVNTGIYRVGTDQLGLAAGGTQIARFGSSGVTPYEPILFNASVTSVTDVDVTAMRLNLTSNNANGMLGIVRGLDIDITNASSGGTVQSYGIDYNYTISDAVSSVRIGFLLSTDITTAQSDWRGINIFDPSGAGSLTTAYGLKIEPITFGTTNWGLAVGGTTTNSHIAGNLRIGSTATPTAKLHLAAGSATVNTAPLKFTSGTLLTTAEAGATEYDGTAFYSTPVASGRGVSPSEFFISLTAPYALGNVSGTQKVFNVGTGSNGAITLPGSTSYFFEGMYNIICVGATTNILSLLFGGTATITSIAYSASVTNGTVTTPTAAPVSFVNTAAATAVTATLVASNRTVIISGIVRINGTGTFIPQFSLSAAPGTSVTVSTNSYFKMHPIGSNTVNTVGNW